MRDKYNEFPSVPVNPRLKFGAPLEKICENGILHPGLRDLFLKSYLNATGTNKIDHGTLKENNIQQVLSPGIDGQGSLDDRLMLKERLQKGKYIISYRTPPGAPLWLLRHFLGRLPEPLLTNCVLVPISKSTIPPWLKLAEECRNAIELASSGVQTLRRLKFLVATELVHLSKENFCVLSALIGLIRNLAADQSKKNSLKKQVTFSLTCYFTQAITRRPYRPGNVSPEEKMFYPLVLFLIYYWPDLRKIVTNMDSKYNNFIRSNEFNPRQSNSLPGFKRNQNVGHRKSKSLDISFLRQRNKSIDNDKIERNQIENKLMLATNKEDSMAVQKKSVESIVGHSNPVFEQIVPISFKCDNCKIYNIIEAKIRVSPISTASCNCMNVKISPEQCTVENSQTTKIGEVVNLSSVDNCSQSIQETPWSKKPLQMSHFNLQKPKALLTNENQSFVDDGDLKPPEHFPTLVHDKTSLIKNSGLESELWVTPNNTTTTPNDDLDNKFDNATQMNKSSFNIGWKSSKVGVTSTPRNSDFFHSTIKENGKDQVELNVESKSFQKLNLEPSTTVNNTKFYDSMSSLESSVKSDSSKTTSSVTKLFSKLKFRNIRQSLKMLKVVKDQHNDSASLILIENRH